MTKDVIALTPEMPDTWALLAGLYAGGPRTHVSAGSEGAVLRLCAPDGRPLVSVEAPLLVQVPGEAERLLGREVPVPFWWTEARASGAVPEAERLAGSVCGRLALLLGGSTWPETAASTDVVDVGAVVAPDDGQPVVDVLTGSTAVVLADRPVLALTTWLSEVLRDTAESGRALQIVTPPHVRLSAPARATLLQPPNRWVVQDPSQGYYDGLSGAVLRWQDGTFAPALGADGTASVAEAFGRTSPSAERQLTVAFRTTLPAQEDVVLGDGVETAWRALTGSPPAGWGTAEPVNLPWSPRRLTGLARDRAPEPTHLIVAGHPGRPALAWIRVTRTTAGVEQDVTLTLGYGEGEAPPLDAITPLAETLVERHGLTTMLVSVRRAPRDLTTAPVLHGPPLPVAFTLGARDVGGIGLTHARRPPVAARPVALGPAAAPALHYPLGDGTDPRALTELQQLAAHLRAGMPGAEQEA
ncbi:hypothetical protein KMT30_29885 [Streptomyces sp. IBSBF 2953]|uniref:DUF6177 family protein n=1 Tax=Streptomyces sp. B21-097 TaxID=3039414 RepID=UPI00211A9760|nr:hypothetical protein [Streptomyces hayashii]